MMTSPAVLIGSETCLLVIFRALLFFGSRKYLLRALYHDLQDLSSDAEPLAANTDAEIELETLPTPSTATRQDNARLPRKRTFHSTVSRTLFSGCFSECCTLFILLIFQGLEILHARTRLLNWKISLWLLLATIVVLIPLSYSLVLSYRSASGVQVVQRPTLTRLILTTLPVAIFLFLLSFIPIPSGLSSSAGLSTLNVLPRLTVLGTVILGILSGFGAISNAWRFFPVVSASGSKQPTDADVSAAEEGLKRVRMDLAERRRSVERLQLSEPDKSETSWMSRVATNLRGDNQLTNAMQEISGLEALEYQMARNLQALKDHRAEVKFSKTLSGIAFNWAGRIFAIYCVYRILVSILNLLLPSHTTSVPSPTPQEPSNSRTDFITVFLAYLFSFLPAVTVEQDDIAVISRQISLALVGVIILSSIRLVLRGVARALRVTSRKLGASLMLLMLAQLMGIYLLSTLVQLRTSFPPPPTRPDTEADTGIVNLFSTLPEYQVFGTVFDSSFLLAAVVTAVVRWFNQRINSVGIVDTS